MCTIPHCAQETPLPAHNYDDACIGEIAHTVDFVVLQQHHMSAMSSQITDRSTVSSTACLLTPNNTLRSWIALWDRSPWKDGAEITIHLMQWISQLIFGCVKYIRCDGQWYIIHGVIVFALVHVYVVTNTKNIKIHILLMSACACSLRCPSHHTHQCGAAARTRHLMCTEHIYFTVIGKN